jgi:small subunit ribosomal protein S6
MRKYETIFISDPDLKDQTRQELFDKVRDIIATEKGILLNFDEWGNKKLAYEIKKKTRGHYVCVTYGGTGELINELERNFRLRDTVLKFMTILLSNDVSVEQLEEEARENLEAAEEAAAEAAAKAAPKPEAVVEKEAAAPEAETKTAAPEAETKAPAPEAADDAKVEEAGEKTE